VVSWFRGFVARGSWLVAAPMKTLLVAIADSKQSQEFDDTLA
jgi:hypothetical protein